MKQDPDGVTVCKLLKVPGLRDREVLEIGCGDGRITAGLVTQVKRMVAVDPDAEALEKARSRIPRAGFQKVSGEQLDLPDSSFDAVLFTLSLHHQNPRKALREAARVTKDSGTILVLEPVAGSEIERICRPLEDERQALLVSLYALMEGPWKIRQKEFFDVQWVFEDQRELVRWVFEYYGRPFQEEPASRIIEVLGEKSGNQPLVIEDRLLLVALSQGSRIREE
jgi:SAM-dependent methyltransferase